MRLPAHRALRRRDGVACRVRRQPDAGRPPRATPQPDRFLFERANDSMKRERGSNARTYFQQIVDNYPQSPLRPDAKLGMGDTYLGEGGDANRRARRQRVPGVPPFYPTSMRADYAQYKLAMSHFRQMRRPSATRPKRARRSRSSTSSSSATRTAR